MIITRDARKGQMVGKWQIIASDELGVKGICITSRTSEAGRTHYVLYKFNGDAYHICYGSYISEPEAWMEYARLFAEMIRDDFGCNCAWMVETVK